MPDGIHALTMRTVRSIKLEWLQAAKVTLSSEILSSSSTPRCAYSPPAVAMISFVCLQIA